MKIIEPHAELIDDINAADIYAKIERCGRVCYQSQPTPAIVIKEGDFSQEDIAKISTDIQSLKTMEPPSVQFVRKLIKRGHESVLEHVSLTFHIVCDRAIMAELTRHRLASFSVESTRYCKYDELEVLLPIGFDEPNPLKKGTDAMIRYCVFFGMVEQAECRYKGLLDAGATPEQARAVLPLCLKSELYMTANLREWRYILKLRTSKHVHPQMRLIMNQILAEFKEKLPVIVEDIKEAES